MFGCRGDAEACGRDLMWGSGGIYEDGVGNVWYDGGAGGRLGCPARDDANECRRDVLGGGIIGASGDVERAVGKEPEGVLGSSLAWDLVVLDPVDGDKDDERMRGAEVDE